MKTAENPSSFPWTYDQLQRYAVLRLLVEELGQPLRVLDVGGAAADRVGTGFWLPAAEILAGTGADVMVADVSDCGLPGFIKASGTDLPFADGSFDVVSAFDVLEHVSKAERAAFLNELGRISSRIVLVSCPTKSPGVEQAEALLNAEILRQYGIEHGMLVEHRTHGLPLEEEIAAALEGAGLTAASFGYGALSTWLAYQAFRSSFLLRMEAPRATEAIDRYWAGQPQAAELSAPFYRRYWIATKTKPAEAGYLNGLEKAMKEQLKKNGLKPILEKDGRTDAFDRVERVAREILSRPFVSAVVATTGEPAFLGPCLDTLLTQIVDFDLEIAVWNFEKRDDTAAWLACPLPPSPDGRGRFRRRGREAPRRLHLSRRRKAFADFGCGQPVCRVDPAGGGRLGPGRLGAVAGRFPDGLDRDGQERLEKVQGFERQGRSRRGHVQNPRGLGSRAEVQGLGDRRRAFLPPARRPFPQSRGRARPQFDLPVGV